MEITSWRYPGFRRMQVSQATSTTTQMGAVFTFLLGENAAVKAVLDPRLCVTGNTFFSLKIELAPITAEGDRYALYIKPTEHSAKAQLVLAKNGETEPRPPTPTRMVELGFSPQNLLGRFKMVMANHASGLKAQVQTLEATARCADQVLQRL